MERIGIDILGPLPETVSSKAYIMVVSCYFLKWIDCLAVPDQQVYAVADEKVVTKFFTRFELLLFLLTDFEFWLFQKVCNLLGLQKTLTRL